MSQQNLLRNYSNNIKRLKQVSQDAGLAEEEFKQMYLDSLKEIGQRNIPRHRLSVVSKYKFYIICLIVIAVITYNVKPIYSIIICNLQEYIYPGLRLLRRLAIPFISLFPSLSDLYDDTCIIQNPFFTVVDMDCWPCSSVNNVREVTDPGPATQLHNAPFIYETEQISINLKKIEELYNNNKEIFDHDAPSVFMDNRYHTTPNYMFNSLHDDSGDKSLYIWKLNNMTPARILRQLIPRPKVVPKFGQSTERFLIIDNSQSAIKIPDTECNFSFLLFLKGNRRIHLRPAEECRHQCKSLQIDLTESYLLWYNWWYWRPIVQPSYNNDTLIAHIGSYC